VLTAPPESAARLRSAYVRRVARLPTSAGSGTPLTHEDVCDLHAHVTVSSKRQPGISLTLHEVLRNPGRKGENDPRVWHRGAVLFDARSLRTVHQDSTDEIDRSKVGAGLWAACPRGRVMPANGPG
jgi:hypothetical protein